MVKVSLKKKLLIILKTCESEILTISALSASKSLTGIQTVDLILLIGDHNFLQIMWRFVTVNNMLIPTVGLGRMTI